MQKSKLSQWSLCLVLVIHFAASSSAEPTLGDAPRAPKDISGLPGNGPKPRLVTGSFSVNPNAREQVREFYNAIFTFSANTPINSTAVISNCIPGTNSPAFINVTLRQINWFRALAGLPAAVSFDAGEGIKDQAAALMMSEHNALQHVGDWTGWDCFSSNGTNASANSNIALGFDGPDAITAYVWDAGANNYEVGHRRWILYPQTQIMATGDVPAQNTYAPANATWVFDANIFGPRPATRTPYVTWPPAGFVPYQVVYPQWSFALTNADLSAATVSMSSNGVSVPVTLQSYVTGYGENTVVWYPTSLDPNSYATLFPFNGTDTVYTITVGNVGTIAGPKSFTYNVTAFDPAAPGIDYVPQIISGTNQPVVGAANPYHFVGLTNATSYQWRSVLRTPYNFADGAENGLTNFIVNVSPGYTVPDSSVKATGNYSFHLAMPAQTDQTLTLNQTFTPQSNTVVLFASRLGYAASSQAARVQVSIDSGLTWANVFSQTGATDITGLQNESAFANHAIALTNYIGIPVQLRFDLGLAAYTAYYNGTDSNYGWHIDNIIVTNAEVWTAQATNSLASTNFIFTPTQLGNYNLQARGVIFTEFPLAWEPAKSVTAIAGAPFIVLNAPIITGNQVKINFSLVGTATTFRLLQTDQLGAAWTTNTSATLITNVLGSTYQFTTTNGPAARFYRVVTP